MKIMKTIKEFSKKHKKPMRKNSSNDTIHESEKSYKKPTKIPFLYFEE